MSIRDVVIEPDTKITDLPPESAEVRSDALVTVTMFEAGRRTAAGCSRTISNRTCHIIRSLRLRVETA